MKAALVRAAPPQADWQTRMETSQVIVRKKKQARDVSRASVLVPVFPAAVFLALGSAIAAVGLIDLGFAWLPWQFGNREWEFGTVARTFDGLALPTVGFALMTAGALGMRSRAVLLVNAALSSVLLLALVGGVALYALNLPVAHQALPPEARGLLERSAMRTGGFVAVFLAFYGWLSWFTWRAVPRFRREEDPK